MLRRSTRLVRFTAAGAILACGALGGGAAAFANGSPTVTITAGSLTMTSPVPGSFSSVALNGSTQTTTATIPSYSVVDATGSGLGWNVTVAATQFCAQTSGVCPSVPPHNLPVGMLSLGLPSATPCGTCGPAPAANAVNGIDGTGGSKQLSAAAGNGMGTYTIGAVTATLTIPADTYAATYVSTVTYTLASAP